MCKRFVLALAVAAVAVPTWAADPKPATSRVTAVTIYPNSALVTREVDVPEGTGLVELVVTPLPPLTLSNSLYSEGTDGLRVLTTRFRSRAVKEDTREEVRKLQDQLKQLQLAAQKIQADVKAAEQNLLMLTKLESFTAATTAQATEKANLNGETVITLSKYVMDQRAEKTKQMVGLQQELQDKTKAIEFANRKLRELSAGSSKTEQDAVIVLDKGKTNATGKIKLNYLVEAASWQPQYKLRAGKTEKDTVQIEFLAGIVQQTGEDWDGVNLVLSTAQPMLNAAPPDLMVLDVQVMSPGGKAVAQMPNPPGQQLVPVFNQPPGASAPQPNAEKELQMEVQKLRVQAQLDINDQKKQVAGINLYNTAAAFEQSWELTNPLAVASKGKPINRGGEGPSVTYHLTSKLSVPSRNDEQVLEVARIDLTPEYYYKAVPVLTRNVYRLANLTNKSNYVLLPGEATMYVGSDFVGRMALPLVAIGEQFTAGFGIDPQMQVQRQMTDKTRTSQGGNQVLKYEYRILVSSYKTDAVNLQVWDRLPHAEAETMAVTLVKALPEVSTDSLYVREHRPNNLLRWDLKVEPSMNGEKAMAVNYEFKLELDRQMTIGSFATK